MCHLTEIGKKNNYNSPTNGAYIDNLQSSYSQKCPSHVCTRLHRTTILIEYQKFKDLRIKHQILYLLGEALQPDFQSYINNILNFF